MKNARTAVVYDLHGTLADTSHRRHLAPAPEDQGVDELWTPWSLACGGDTPIPGMIARLKWDFPYHQVHICSAQGAVAYKQTREWLARCAGDAYDYLVLRTRGDDRPGRVLKAEYILKLQEDGIDVRLAYEDLKKDADYITKQTGVPVVLVNPAYEWIEVLRDSSGRAG